MREFGIVLRLNLRGIKTSYPPSCVLLTAGSLIRTLVLAGECSRSRRAHLIPPVAPLVESQT